MAQKMVQFGHKVKDLTLVITDEHRSCVDTGTSVVVCV